MKARKTAETEIHFLSPEDPAVFSKWIEPFLTAGKSKFIDFLKSARWFRAKGAAVLDVAVDDWAAFETEGFLAWLLLIVRVALQGQKEETYFVPLTVQEAQEAHADDDGQGPVLFEICSEGRRLLCRDGFLSPELDRWLAGQSLLGGHLAFAHGKVRFVRLERGPSDTVPRPEIRVRKLKVEQSNTSLIVEERFILKIFRKLESGISPEAEMLNFLTRHRFPAIPQLRAEIFYEGKHKGPSSLGLMQDFVKSESDGWTYVLTEMKRYYSACFSPEEGKNAGGFLEKGLLPCIRRLGEDTGRMHAILASEQGIPLFCPEPIRAGDVRYWQDSFKELVKKTLKLLRASTHEKAKMFSEALAGREPELLGHARAFSLLADHGIQKIRHHGDYHLGQVLKAGMRWFIIDFEGEPMRNLEERKRKTCVFKDIAGMLRSFHYASHVSSAEFLRENPEITAGPINRFAASGEEGMRRAFLDGYFDACRTEIPLASADDRLLRRLLGIFELEKAVYELNYELNNRPNWAGVPAEGIFRLLQLPESNHSSIKE